LRLAVKRRICSLRSFARCREDRSIILLEERNQPRSDALLQIRVMLLRSRTELRCDLLLLATASENSGAGARGGGLGSSYENMNALQRGFWFSSCAQRAVRCSSFCSVASRLHTRVRFPSPAPVLSGDRQPSPPTHCLHRLAKAQAAKLYRGRITRIRAHSDRLGCRL
jgi:hypothetical protein